MTTGPIPLERVRDWRRELRALAWALAAVGVPADVVLDTARAGIADAVTAHSRSGR